MKKHIYLTAGLILTLATFWVGGYFLFLGYISQLQPQNINTRTDAIVVLTGGDNRIQTGLSLWADEMAPELFITGVQKNIERQTIFQSWDNAEKSLPLCCMTLGYMATSTVENAQETKEWVAENSIRSIRMVTSAYHTPRAFLEIKKAMPKLTVYLHPVPDRDFPKDGRKFFRYTFLEYHKLLWRLTQIYVFGLFA